MQFLERQRINIQCLSSLPVHRVRLAAKLLPSDTMFSVTAMLAALSFWETVTCLLLVSVHFTVIDFFLFALDGSATGHPMVTAFRGRAPPTPKKTDQAPPLSNGRGCDAKSPGGGCEWRTESRTGR